MSYSSFLLTKRKEVTPSGIDIALKDINNRLFEFQRSVVMWALNRGKAAVFASCGLGKTNIQMEWAHHVSKYTNKPVLIVAPLAVSKQTIREGEKFGYVIHGCRKQEDVKAGEINITNYEMLSHFTPGCFSGIVCDESSILKHMFGKIRKQVIEFASVIDFRLACTATPAPNDYFEICNHSEFLGILSTSEVLSTYFTQDFTSTSHKWKIKGHAHDDFWLWVSEWARAFNLPSDLGFEDDGYILPELNIQHHIIDTDPSKTGNLFVSEAKTLHDQRKARRESLMDRVRVACNIVNTDNEQWLIWTDLNDESALAKKMIKDSVEVKGSDSIDHKEKSMIGFADMTVRVLISKPSIAGHGMNWQQCHNVIFLGLSHSFENFYQAVRRCWRFGQTRPVNIHIITSDVEGGVINNIKRKEAQAEAMFHNIVKNMAIYQTDNNPARNETAVYSEDSVKGQGWEMLLGDSVETIDKLADDSVGLILFSPPFPGLYLYTNSPRDMGNTASFEEMLEHFSFLVPKMMRILKPGRSCCVHLTQGIAFKHKDGFTGLKDFRGRVIQMMIDSGWNYYGEVTIDKDPQIKAIRTKDVGLLFKTLATDSSKCRQALADYILQFVKPGENTDPIKAGVSKKYQNNDGWITPEEWIEWAAPVWYRKSQHYPGGVSETDVLNAAAARSDKDERHLCPLQLGVIERCIKLWSNPGDIVYSPFAGIGSEGYKAVELNRKFIGGELKPEYFRAAVSNLLIAEKSRKQGFLFDY